MTAQPALTMLSDRQQQQRGPAPPHVRAAHPVPVYQEPEPEPEQAVEWTYEEAKILWLEVADSIAPSARLGIVNTVYGPLFILRVRGEDDAEAEREVKGF